MSPGSSGIVDSARRRGLGEGRHVGQVPALGVAGTNPVKNGALDLGDPALAVKPIPIREIGNTLAGVALQVSAVAVGAIAVIGGPRVEIREISQRRVLADRSGVGASAAPAASPAPPDIRRRSRRAQWRARDRSSVSSPTGATSGGGRGPQGGLAWSPNWPPVFHSRAPARYSNNPWRPSAQKPSEPDHDDRASITLAFR